jgi:hypothetical protein
MESFGRFLLEAPGDYGFSGSFGLFSQGCMNGKPVYGKAGELESQVAGLLEVGQAFRGFIILMYPGPPVTLFI